MAIKEAFDIAVADSGVRWADRSPPPPALSQVCASTTLYNKEHLTVALDDIATCVVCAKCSLCICISIRACLKITLRFK